MTRMDMIRHEASIECPCNVEQRLMTKSYQNRHVYVLFFGKRNLFPSEHGRGRVRRVRFAGQKSLWFVKRTCGFPQE